MALRAGLAAPLLWLTVFVLSSSGQQTQFCRQCICTRSHAVLCNLMSVNFVSVPPQIPNDTITLDLSRHAITGLRDNAFSSLKQLQTLRLSSNHISFIAPAAFSGLDQLEYLDLSHNSLTGLPNNVFVHTPNLKKLYLHGNDIVTLTRHTFGGLTNLQYLSVNVGALSRLSHEVIVSMENLVTLNVTDGQLHCDCSVAWMQDYAPLHADFLSPLTCRSPAHLAGRKIDELTLDDLQCVVPSVQAAVREVAAYSGQSRVLTCLVEGAPPEDLSWSFGGQPVTDSGNLRLLSNGSLHIVAMTAELQGEYTCLSSNSAGIGTATISVEFLGVLLPRLLLSPSNTHAFPGESVLLHCQGDQYTEGYRWLRRGQAVSLSGRVQAEADVGLHIHNVTMRDSGSYTCVAMGNSGTAQGSAILNVTGPLLSCEGVIDADTVDTIRSKVNFAFNRTSQSVTSSPHQLLRQLRLPDNGSIALLKAGDVFQGALETVRASHDGDSEGGVPSLSMCEVRLLAELSGCLEHSPAPDCSDVCFHSRYRSVDGSCNNWNQPRWGMTDSPFQRLLAPDYDDGLGLPMGWLRDLPSARHVSQSLVRAHSVESSTELTHMLMQIGQFVDHDLDLSPGTPSEVSFSSGAMCDSECSNSAPCFPIPVLAGDVRLTGQCMPFTRSGGVCGTGSSSLLVGDSPIWREQINAITSFLDSSMIYGSSEEHAQRLRDPHRPGWLVEGLPGPGGKPFLPFDEHSLIACMTGRHVNRSACFLGGDVRTNEQVGLTTMHIVFFREHNRVATVLSRLNPHWGQERVFQETRRLVGAEWQNIVYTEYLPKILGSSGMEILGGYQGYDPSVNPTIANVFATAAFRFGHSQIMPVFQRLGEDYEPLPVGPLFLRDAFFAPFRLLEEGGIDPLLRGLLASGVKRQSPDSVLNSNLTEALFAQAHEVALDLAALNIQRGRDHGVPSYIHWREFCGLPTENPLEDIPSQVQTKLLEVYSNVADVDLWVGGLLERQDPGAQLGPTFSCIIAGQFRKIRDGDRFWFERPGQFTPDQLVQLRQASLSRVICDNADAITRVPRDAFTLMPVEQFSECSELPTVDLDLWTDCQGTSPVSERDRRSVLMSAVAEEVGQLRETVARLEHKAGGCLVNGVQYHHRDEWSLNSCTSCSCQMGEVVCSKQAC